MKRSLLIGVVLMGVAAWAFSDVPSFSKYQVIIDKKPFGEEPPPPPEPIVPINPADSFASKIRMSALLEMDDGTLKVGIIDMANNNASIFLAEGESENGIELVSVNYEDEEAVLRKGSEMAVIKLSGGDVRPLTPGQQSQQASGAPPTSRRMSYAERRAARMRQRAEPPPQPKYTGAELEQHLQEYQMEVIRQGLPPLPIPLTPEMDQQLVNEGILPPVE